MIAVFKSSQKTPWFREMLTNLVKDVIRVFKLSLIILVGRMSSSH